MSAVSDAVAGIPDRDYALSIISPFHAASKGTRIPNIQAIQTVTGTNFQDLGTFQITASTNSLMFTSFTCFNTAPWVLINGLSQNVLDQAPVARDVLFFLQAPGAFGPAAAVEYATRLVNTNITTSAAFLSQFIYGVSPNVSGLFSSVRVASAGYRIFKTSASTTESGIIKGFYSDRGTYVAKNIAQVLNYF